MLISEHPWFPLDRWQLRTQPMFRCYSFFIFCINGIPVFNPSIKTSLPYSGHKSDTVQHNHQLLENALDKPEPGHYSLINKQSTFFVSNELNIPCFRAVEPKADAMVCGRPSQKGPRVMLETASLSVFEKETAHFGHTVRYALVFAY